MIDPSPFPPDCASRFSMESDPEELLLDRKLKARILLRARERLKKKLRTLRLENRQIEEARRIATAKGMVATARILRSGASGRRP